MIISRGLLAALFALTLAACGSEGDDSAEPGDSGLDCEAPATFYADDDDDGYGDPAAPVEACEAPSGTVSDSTDCDDSDAGTHPGATEFCDGLDQDCDGVEDNDGVDPKTWYDDQDGDGFGDPDSGVESCQQPEDTVSNDRDCDDDDDTIWPGATEICDGIDQDCDGVEDNDTSGTFTWYPDEDEDGYGDEDLAVVACDKPSGYVAQGEDCNDGDASIHPDATEVCDGEVDENCDGQVDEGLTSTWYSDFDGDEYGDPTTGVVACTAPDDHVSDNTDCDDRNAGVNPGETEVCDEADQNCNGDIDEGLTSTFYLDSDGDDYGDPSSTIDACTLSEGYADNPDDCDDSDAGVNPGAAEVCDGATDENCDGSVDEGLPSTFYLDNDSDGYGDVTSTTEACTVPSGYSADGTDCDDTDGGVNPGATEVCDGSTDENCDGNIDEGLESTWFYDADGDSYGDPSVSTVSCTAPTSYVADSTDCDDTDGGVNPGATEVCDGATDENCDGNVDEGLGGTWYADDDNDGYGDDDTATETCNPPSGYVTQGGDCDDTDSGANPGATEVCDGSTDENCDGNVDEGLTSTYYYDNDGDSYGNASDTIESCSAPSGYVTESTDCDDDDSGTYPGATEVCDGADQDCDGDVDEGVTTTYYRDVDNDGYGTSLITTEACSAPSGYVSNSTDCQDGDASINPGATEVCDGSTDENCDGNIDEGVTITSYLDGDGDGYGSTDAGSSTTGCLTPPGYVTDNTDCDDGTWRVNPGASELCDGVDTDCDASTSEDAMASFIDTSGTYSDITSSVTGSGGSVASYTASTAGDLVFCDGTFDVSIAAVKSVRIYSQNGDRDQVVLSGANQASVIWNSLSGVSIDVYDVTLSDGYGSYDAVGIGYDTGGALACGGASTKATLTNVVMENNYAEMGGAFANSCDVTVTDSEIRNNQAMYGGAFFNDGGTQVTLDNTTFEGNTADYYGGVAYVYGYGGSATVDATDTVFTGNTAAYDGGAFYVDGWSNTSAVTCNASSGASAGFDTNTAGSGYGGAFYLSGTYATLDSTTCDFGTHGGSDANSPYSIYPTGAAAFYEPGADATFGCDYYGCESATNHTVAGSTYSTTLSGSSYWSVFKADSTATLESWQVYINPAGSCTVDLVMLSATSSSSAWTTEWSTSKSVSSGAQWLDSGQVGLPVVEGYYYGLATAVDCGSYVYVYYDYTTSGSTDHSGFGDHVGYNYSSYASGDYASGYSSGGYNSSSIGFYMVTEVTEL